jgi:Rrf2 family protein
MKLSTKSRYGLRILIQIALDNIHYKRLAQGKKIAERQGLTEAYLEQMVIPFKKNGILGTVRGCNGGYELIKSPEDITVLDIIEIFEGKIRFADCSSPDNNKKCKRTEICPAAHIWKKLENSFRSKAAEISLQEILEHYRKQMIPDYVI